MEPILLSLCETVGHRLRAQNLEGDVIELGIKDASFHYRSSQCKIFYPTDSTKTVFQTAIFLFDRLWKNEPIRHLSITVSNLKEIRISQLSFFSANTEQQKKAEQTIDRIREQYGNESIKKAILLGKQVPAMSGGTGNETRFPAMNSVL